MTIVIADNSPRISYVATQGQTVFTIPFEFFNDTDINLYIDDVLKELETDYTVSGGDGTTGTLILVTGATAGDVIVLTRSIPLERVTDFPTSGPFQVASLNVELDKVIAMIADLEDLANRGLRLSDSDTTLSLTLRCCMLPSQICLLRRAPPLLLWVCGEVAITSTSSLMRQGLYVSSICTVTNRMLGIRPA